MKTALAADPVCKHHDAGGNHPESPARFDASLAALQDGGFLPVASRQAQAEELALCHSRGYLRLAAHEIASGYDVLSTGDTPVCPGSMEAALHAAGSVLNAVDAVMDGRAANAFCVVRPPGHHATPDRGMGFCIFNNVAIAARYAQRRHGITRVLIADWDVHHGNGTQDIFYDDGSVFFFSTHQHPWYPGTGAATDTGYGDGAGTTLNCPFPAGAGRNEIVGAFKERLVPAMEDFKPELILISAGFDSRAGDPLGGFRLTDQDFADLTFVLKQLADRYAAGRLVSVLEGGYNLSGLASAVRAHASALREPSSTSR